MEESHKCALKKVLDDLAKATTLAIPDYSKEFIVISDAAGGQSTEQGGIGAVLAQYNDRGQLIPIQFFSRPLKKRESAYNSYKKELLAVVSALDSFHKIIYGSKIVVNTDCISILSGYMNAHPTDSVLIAMAQKLSAYGPTVEYIKGETNFFADMLSRSVADSIRRDRELNSIKKSKRSKMIKNPPEYVSDISGEEDVVNVNVNNDGSEVNGSQGKLDVDTILDGNLNLVRDMQRNDPFCNVMYYSLLCGRMCSQKKFDNAKISKRIALYVHI